MWVSLRHDGGIGASSENGSWVGGGDFLREGRLELAILCEDLEVGFSGVRRTEWDA